MTAGAVARRLGVAVTTLRTWHQRYGLGPSHHIPGHHRRYTGEDLARLDVMRRLTARGVAPAEAAAWARRISDTAALAAAPPPATANPTGPDPRSADPPTVSPARDGGGHAIPVGRAGPGARGLARAAMRLDGTAMRDLLHSYVAAHGVIATWEDVIVPVLVGIGDRYAATQRLIEVEHLASRCITETLSTLGTPALDDTPRILLACADEEQHSLPMEALAAALAEHDTPSRLLGARVPPGALTDAVERTGPAVVVVWSQLPHTADPSQLNRLLTARHRPLLVAAAGPGWNPDTLPAGVPHLTSLQEAVQVSLDIVQPERRAG